MNEVLITCILSSTLAVAIVNSVKDLVLWKLNRKATEEDKEDIKEDKIEDLRNSISDIQDKVERLTEICTVLEKRIGSTSEADKLILQDRIKSLVFSYVNKKEITYEDKKLIHEMWNIYHHGLGGNGDLDDVMELLDEIPLKVK